MKKRWKVNPANKELQVALARELDVLPLTAGLLINRGLVEADRASLFLRPDLAALHDPFLFEDMGRAVERIIAAMRGKEKIVVYGDYDVDGVTSCSLVYLFMKECGIEIESYIPERQSEGYGLNIEAIKKLAAAGVKLLITVDCGSSNSEEIAFANTLGINVIVTDHHEMSGTPPPAFALINPKSIGCAFPFSGLAGVGVAFNLVMALRTRLRSTGWFSSGEPNLKKLLDIVAIGTVADMVPLVDENRIFVSFGLRELEATGRPGLKALKDVSRIRPGKCDASAVGYQLAPRINAAGRVSKASLAFRLLTTDDASEAVRLAETLNGENSSRQRLEEGILNEALTAIGTDVANKGIVLAKDNWHMGVIGIVASRLVDRFGRPVVMITVDRATGVGKGSARGIKSFDILKGLKTCEDLLERYGGHKAAAGITVKPGMIESFTERFMKYLNDMITDDDLVREINIDAIVTLDDLNERAIDEITSMAPFGAANSEPLLAVREARIIETEVVGSKHLKFKLNHNGFSRSGIGFGLAAMHPMKGDGYALAFSPFFDEWQGSKHMKLRIRDVQAHWIQA